MDRSALGVVMQFCRVAGVAPFKQGDEYHVIMPLVICANLFMTFTAISYTIFSVTSLWNKELNIAINVLRISSHIFTIFTAFVSVVTSSARTLRIIRFYKELDKLDEEIQRDSRQNINETKLTILILIFLHLRLALRGYDFYSFNFPTTYKSWDYSVRVMLLITYYMVDLSEIILSLFAKRSYLSLKLINDSLEELNKSHSMEDILQMHVIKELSILSLGESRIKPVRTRPKKIQEPAGVIRQCVENYLHLCNIISTCSEGDAILMAFLIMRYIIQLLLHAYRIIILYLSLDLNNLDPSFFKQIVWFIIYSITLSVFVEPIHKTESQMQRLQTILTSLQIKNKTEKDDINNELLLFWRIIKFNKPTYSPLGMFDINRSLIFKIFGALITYLVITVSYGPEANQSKDK